MPNLPDLTKTIYYQRTYSRKKLRALRNRFAAFNAQYSTMIERISGDAIATRNTLLLTSFDFGMEQVRSPMVCIQIQDTHGLFALWFWNAAKSRSES